MIYSTGREFMEIQNISGSDMVSGGMNVNSRVSSENTNVEKPEPTENIPSQEKEKGNYIDTKA
jgi:hypothetical protein